MKKFLSIILTIITLLGCLAVFSSCETNIYSQPKKITDYLYEITYKDYRKDYNYETISGDAAFGCSSVRNGNFYGRNFDYIFNTVPEFIVKVEAAENRHASIGIATHFGLREANMEEYSDQLELIPNFTLDGINDAGVICSHNVVPAGDNNIVDGTNPSGEDLHMLFIPRFVLDNASSADEAVELIKSRNIIGSIHDGHYYLHIMIADKDKTYIVEFYNNEVIAKEKKDNEQIMTNYYLNLDRIPNDSQGIERYNILQKNYNLGNTFDGMQQLLRLVQYNQTYEYNNGNLWLSELFKQSEILSGVTEQEDFDEKIEELFTAYRNVRNLNLRVDDNEKYYWFTTHNSTYDIENKTLRVYVQENYEKYYEYKLGD